MDTPPPTSGVLPDPPSPPFSPSPAPELSCLPAGARALLAPCGCGLNPALGEPASCGVLHPIDGAQRPIGDTPFLQLVDAFARRSHALAAQGARLLVCKDMPGLAQCRCALIGARATGLPVYIGVELCTGGRLPEGSDALACLVTLQNMGAAAFGFSRGPRDEVYDAVLRLAPHAQIPLIARACAAKGENSGGVPAPDLERAGKLVRAGASVLWARRRFSPAHLEALYSRLCSLPPARRLGQDRHPIKAACEDGAFMLEEGFEFPEPLRCSLEMADDILRMEYEGHDVLLVRIDTVDDAHCFALNAHMSRLPAAFCSDSEEALEMALALYHGRAILSSVSDLPRATLNRLAAAYGAIVI